ncbi:MAG: sensor of ECF-type sigma factor [Flaviramulus sp.]|nr:sensor of ECF-type sigma factor [Flaviramulus sp.]
MKKITIILLLFTSLSLFSQSRRDKIKALKVSFITERLNLTQQEAQKFWPIYNDFDDNYLKIKHSEIRSINKEFKSNTVTLSDEKANELLNKLMDAENKLHNLDIDLIAKLKKVISPKKIILLKQAEEDFNKKLFEQFKKWREEGRKDN